jgi:hypothetical protein
MRHSSIIWCECPTLREGPGYPLAEAWWVKANNTTPEPTIDPATGKPGNVGGTAFDDVWDNGGIQAIKGRIIIKAHAFYVDKCDLPIQNHNPPDPHAKLLPILSLVNEALIEMMYPANVLEGVSRTFTGLWDYTAAPNGPYGITKYTGW